MTGFNLEPVATTCPNCSMTIELLVDCSMSEQRYVADCPRCNCPMAVHAMISDDDIPLVSVLRARDL